MDAPAFDTAEAKEAEGAPAPQRLVAAVAAFSAPGFAVIDGAHFDDLPALLRENALFGRSLFLDHADIEVERAGPWLVALNQRTDAANRVFALVGEKPAAIFWACAAGEVVLHRHLRTLNLALVPAWAAIGESAPRADGSGEKQEAVLFRHWDPPVLAALLPTLEADQFSRVLGPAIEIAFCAQEHGGLRRVLADPRWPRASSGLLKLRSDQVVALITRRVSLSRKRLAAYLRNYAPQQTSEWDDEALHAAVLKYETEAHRLGVRNERSIGL